MSIDTIKLPKNDKDLARLIDEHAERELARLSFRRTWWLLAWHYLNGARRFDVFDTHGVRIRAHQLDEEGNMEFQSQELLSQINKVAGMLASRNLGPKVEHEGMSLQGQRERAIAQIVGDSIVSDQQMERVKTQFAHIFTTLGSCGITGHMVDHPTIGLSADLEVIHPKELFPFPSLGTDYTRQQGIMRQRIVPLSFLEGVFGKKSISRKLDNMEWWEIQTGEVLGDYGYDTDIDIATTGGITFSDRMSAGAQRSKDPHALAVAQLREVWMTNGRDTCSEYVVACGDAILHRQDTSTSEKYCPIGYGRFLENGSFHGAGLFDLLYSLSRQLELLMKDLFNNIHELDRYGLLVIPNGSYNERAAFREVGKGLKIFPWEPDPVSENFTPFTVQPYNAGDVPGRTAMFAAEMVDRISPWRDLLDEKGRVDSASGLAFLNEQIQRAAVTATRGLNSAFADSHRATIANAKDHLTISPRPLPVGKLTLDLAGVVIDADKGEVTFPENPLPTISRLRFKVKEESPTSGIARKEEAVKLLELGVNTPDTLLLLGFKEGLDFATWADDKQAAYETVIQNILLLYGDGQTPGQIVETPHTSFPDLQLMVLTGFMSSPAMKKASVDVINQFIDYRESLLEWAGVTLPESVPTPDQTSELFGATQNTGESNAVPSFA